MKNMHKNEQRNAKPPRTPSGRGGFIYQAKAAMFMKHSACRVVLAA